MESIPRIAAIAATLLLHLGLVAVARHELIRRNESPQALPVVVELLPPPAPPHNTTPPAPLPPAPAPAESEKQAAEAKPSTRPRTKPRAAAAPRKRENPLPKPKDDSTGAAAPLPAPATAPAAPSTSSASAEPVAPPTAPAAPTAAPASPSRTGVSIPASYATSNRKPDYPALSRRYGEQGTVVLRVLVQADGTAGKVEIKTSSGYPLLDESALNAVRTWRFHPATSDGKPVAEWYQLAIPFKLQN
ncbi:energy transducer TonB [Noviherbaspirillum massiliense]|uniref:energy transducer TonB n=1 Tax=Noviherbaspirillum massiliense TaxID=1465823 RepID=UPI0002E7B4A2|nr:energy transducer TonB [Noviherbaspirillum massiliense]